MKKYCRLLLFILLSTTLGGCAAEEAVQTGHEESGKPVQIGMCFDSFVIERWQRDRDVFVSTAEDLGAEVNVQNANGEVEKQISQIQYFIEKKVDLLVVIATDAEELSKVVRDAKRAGIRVLCYDRLVSNANADLYISFDNGKVGELMAKALTEELPENANVLLLGGPATDKNVEAVNKTFCSELKKGHIQVLDTMQAENWRAELVYNFLSENYMDLSRVDGIMCGNDDLARQAVRFLSERRKAGQIPVVGQDAELEACQRIVEGTQLMTVYKPVEVLAKSAAEYAVRMAKGEAIDARETIDDGTYFIPYIKLEPVAVTEETMDIITDSGFHLKEDVYLNVPGKMK